MFFGPWQSLPSLDFFLMKHDFICTDLFTPGAVSAEALSVHMKLVCSAHCVGSTDCGSCVSLSIERILAQLSDDVQSCGWFQNDLSVSHTTDHSLTALEEVFGD